MTWLTDEIGCLLHWIESHPGTAAWVQAVGAIGAILIAIAVAWWQQRQARRSEHRARADELINLRRALYTEVAMVANQCLVEFDRWLRAQPPPVVINPRDARLPPLVIFEANAGKAGLLTRDENVHLIEFSGTLHHLSGVVNDMVARELQGPEIRRDIQVLLSNACGSAAKFLAAVGIADANDQLFIEALRKRHSAMDGVRARMRDQSDPPGRADLS